MFSKVEKDEKPTCLLPVDSLTNTEVERAADSITETGLCGSSSTVEAGVPNVSEAAKAATVKLIQATRLPAHHSKLVRVSMDNSKLYGSLCLFEPFLTSLHKMGVTMSDCLVDAQEVITLLMRNQGAEPVLLEGDIVVGCPEPARLIEATEEQDGQCIETVPRLEPLVVAVQNDGPRVKELFTNLGLEKSHLNPEKLQLENLIKEFSDLFAMNNLGRTSLVEHHINTGDHRPIKQLPRRVPHFLKEEVSHHVQEMLDNGVIVPSHSPWASPVVLVAKKDGSTCFCVD